MQLFYSREGNGFSTGTEEELKAFLKNGGNQGDGGVTTIQLVIDGRVIGEVIGDLSRSGFIELDPKSIV